jgi:hypothetical protein
VGGVTRRDRRSTLTVSTERQRARAMRQRATARMVVTRPPCDGGAR